jgi:IMP cyclohydrolase
MALALLALDYEHDSYNTPRIVAGVDTEADAGYLGIVTEGGILVRRMAAPAGECQLVATYELTEPTPIALEGVDAEALAEAVLRCEYEHPVAAMAVVIGADGALDVAATGVAG